MIYNAAAKFDNQAEFLLDQNMCTEACPCLQEEVWKKQNGKRQYRLDPEDAYGRLSEDLLNAHNRTMDATSKKYTPFVFTDDEETGVVSFLQCFERWMDKAEADDSIDLMSVFGMTWEELKKPWKMGPGKKGSRPRGGKKGGGGGGKNIDRSDNDKMTIEQINQQADAAREGKDKLYDEMDKNENALKKWEAMPADKRAAMKKSNFKGYNKMRDQQALAEFLELDFIAEIEEEMECSGVCQTALFYWERDIYSGYPTETCAYAMLEFFRDAAGPLKAELRVVATTLLFIFIFHFSLYGKPGKVAGNEETDSQGQEMQQNPNRFELAAGAGAAPAGYGIQNDEAEDGGDGVVMERHDFNEAEAPPAATPEEAQKNKVNQGD